MAIKNEFTATLPACRCTEETRKRVEAIVAAARCDMADVIRDALAPALVTMEIGLGLATLDDFDDEELIEAGLGQVAEQRRFRAAVKEAAAVVEDRTRGAAWGAPREPVVPPLA